MQARSTTIIQTELAKDKRHFLLHIFEKGAWPTIPAKEPKNSTSALVVQGNDHQQI
jgi:hypothetical protein